MSEEPAQAEAAPPSFEQINEILRRGDHNMTLRASIGHVSDLAAVVLVSPGWDVRWIAEWLHDCAAGLIADLESG